MIKWIVIGVLGLIILGYLGFDVRRAIEAPTTQSNLEYAREAVSHVWTKYLAKPVEYVWKLFIRYVWKPIIQSLEKNLEERVEGETSFEYFLIRT